MNMLEVTDKPRRKDTRNRQERENDALNYRRTRRINAAKLLYAEFDRRVKLRPPILPGPVMTTARTYQHLQERIDEATAEPIL